MNIKKCLLILLPLTALLSSCEVEFSPNAEWKEVPVVYCILDQDEDTTWARVEKCYLGDGNIYSYSSISDSFNYPEGSLQVALLAFRDGQIVDSMPFTYTVLDRDSGNFAYMGQPVYYSRTRNHLVSDCTYELRVRHTADGSLLTSSQPVSLVVKTASQVITKPTSNGMFGFYDHNTGNTSALCRIDWPAMQNARLYQPIIRFYYEVDGDTLHEDFKCNSVKGTYLNTSYSTYYSRDIFLADLYSRLKDDPRLKHYIKKVDIFMVACSEELNAYINTASAAGDIGEWHETYTNMNTGLGVVASRRTHLSKTVPADSSLASDKGLYYLLKNLGINMQ